MSLQVGDHIWTRAAESSEIKEWTICNAAESHRVGCRETRGHGFCDMTWLAVGDFYLSVEEATFIV